MTKFLDLILEKKITTGDYVSRFILVSFTVFAFVAILAYVFFKKMRLPKSCLALRWINKCVIWLFIVGIFVIIGNFVSSFIDNNYRLNYERDSMLKIFIRQIWVQNFLLMLSGTITGVLFRLFVNDLRDIQDNSNCDNN